MPFTFAHPVVVLPLKQAKPKWFSLTGLVAGSMAPDFEYFFKVYATSTVSETFTGIFTFNLPVAIGISLLYHLLVRNPLIRHFPSPYDKRFSGFLKFNFLWHLKRHPWRFLISAFIGIVSHLLLDVVTSPETLNRSFHQLQNTDITNRMLALQAALGDQAFLFLERGISVLGVVFIIWLLSKVDYPADDLPKEHPQQKKKFFGLFATLFVLGMIAAVNFLPYELTAAQLIVNSLSTSMLSLIFTALVFRK